MLTCRIKVMAEGRTILEWKILTNHQNTAATQLIQADSQL
jgi:hypothetical protein